MSSSPSPPPPDLDAAEEQARLAQLEALLAGELFGGPSEPPVGAHSAQESDRPKKRKKHTHDDDAETGGSEAIAEAGGNSEEGAAEVTAFRLFSTQKAPQTVVLREAKSPEPFVLDRRIRAVEDEPQETVEARRLAIERLAVDGKALLAASRLPPLDPLPYAHLRHSRRALLPPALCASHPLPNLAYLNAVLPPSLHKFSPAQVPDEDDPPERPNEGLLAVGPFEAAATTGGEGTVKEKKKKKKKAKATEGEGKNEKKTRDPRPKMPKRHTVEAYERARLPPGQKLVLKVVPILKAEKAGAVVDAKAARARKTRSGGRVSKARRERVKKRLGGGGTGSVAVQAA
ncbi:hypothetical protein JCM6882_005319 [Rhodosporidiobolus microsporus]